MQSLPRIGPIPRGVYKILAPAIYGRQKRIPLAPFHSNEMYGRSGFYIYCNEAEASEGINVLNAGAVSDISRSCAGPDRFGYLAVV